MKMKVVELNDLKKIVERMKMKKRMEAIPNEKSLRLSFDCWQMLKILQMKLVIVIVLLD